MGIANNPSRARSKANEVEKEYYFQYAREFKQLVYSSTTEQQPGHLFILIYETFRFAHIESWSQEEIADDYDEDDLSTYTYIYAY